MKRYALVGLVMLSSGCRAPEDALVSSCTTSVLSLSTECTLRATKLPDSRSSYIDANTKNFKVRVVATFTVAKGRVEVAIPGCEEGGRAQVDPDRPASLQCDAAINRSTFEFTVKARPLEGVAEGFAGKLSFKAI
jgi:hypothetical protein